MRKITNVSRGDLLVSQVNPGVPVVSGIVFSSEKTVVSRILKRPVSVGSELAWDKQNFLDFYNGPQNASELIKWYNPLNWLIRIAINLDFEFSITNSKNCAVCQK